MLKKKISQDIIKLCEHFAEKCHITNIDAYYNRNQKNSTKIKRDVFIGKVAEFGVYYILLEHGIPDITFPDINIYQSNKKSFICDLKTNKNNLHIKTQTKEFSKTFGESWLFQKTDPVVSNPSDNDYFVGTQFDEDHSEVNILLYKKIKDLKFDKPILDKLYNKTCVYLKNNS